MRRRRFLALFSPAVIMAGCAESRGRGRAKRPKGPQGFGTMMAKEWAKDLGDKSPEKRARAAKELANMGPAAKTALPALERAAKDKNKDVAAAAKQAIAAIRK